MNMKTLMLSVAAVTFAVVAGAAQVTYTWKGGTGNWSDPAMWTASDGSTDTYPNSNDSIATFPGGATHVVTFTENISCSNVVMNKDATHVTFRCKDTQYTLTNPTIKNDHGVWAQSKDGSFTMDNIKIAGGGGIFGTPISSYFKAPGENGTLRLTNNAQLNYIVAHLNAKNAKIYLDAGANVQVGACYLNCSAGESFLTISNAYFKYSSPEYPSATGTGTMHFVFQGDSPRFQPNKVVGRGAIFEFEVPDGQYKYYPIDAAEENSLANMNPVGSVFRVSKKSPARIHGVTNTWKIVSWESRVLTDGKYNNGILQANVNWDSLRKGVDSYSFDWRRTGTYAQDPETANPSYMYLTLGPKQGMMLLLR